MTKKIPVLLLVALLTASVLWCSGLQLYDVGDSLFCIYLGAAVPDFIWFPADNSGDTNFLAFSDTHLRTGLNAAISYQVFISPSLALGGEVAYQFCYSRSDMIQTAIPITANLSWFFKQSTRLDIIGGIGAGITFAKYDGNLYLAPTLNLTVEPVVYFSEHWGFGLGAGFTAMAELYFADKTSDTALAAFSPVRLSVHYRR